MIPANPRKTTAFVCPGCLTTFHLYAWEIEEGTPTCSHCMIPLDKVEEGR